MKPNQTKHGIDEQEENKRAPAIKHQQIAHTKGE